jgi:predicted heme/steroid binding protein/uncharacterized membrane protein
MKIGRAIMQIFLAFLMLFPYILSFPASSFATPDYARQTGFKCKHCHIDVIGGGPLTQAGKSFLEDLKVKGIYRPLTTTQHYVRLTIGYLHLMAAIAWFGTIMYVHVLLKPAYASKGLPRGELRLGWLSMIVILITGVLLTIARMPSWEAFYTTRFGVLLSAKIFLFFIMLSSAIIVTGYIGPRLRRKLKSPVAAILSHGITPDQLSHFDGKEGRPAYIAYKGIVYDVSQGRLWKNGAHVMRHSAGNDLTDMLKNAPHGEDKILAMPQLGMLQMNLVLVFVITFIIALWRWW